MLKSFKVQINEKEVTLNKKTPIINLIDDDPKKYVCALVNNRLRELTYELTTECNVKLLTIKDEDSKRTYESSLRYLVAMAFNNLYPKLTINFHYAISRCIYLTITKNKEYSSFKITQDVLKKINKEMKKIIDKDYPIVKEKESKEEAIKVYKKYGYDDKAAILAYRPEKFVHFYCCNDYKNYMYHYMVPSTGFIKDFNLIPYDGGILIQYPRYDNDGKIPSFKDAPVFSKTLRRSLLWNKNVKMSSVSEINKFATEEGAIDFITLCEQHHNNMLSEIGQMIVNSVDTIKLICIAGPSSSGKTTFANRLRAQLMSLGLKPIRISLDDYYVRRDLCPKNPDGSYDFENIEALDVDLINSQLSELLDGQEVTIPKFDFKLGKPVPGRKIKLGTNNPIIIEGIHALNTRITASVPSYHKFKIFIAPQAQINVDNQNPISLTDLRLVRRIVRDSQFRNYPAEDTIAMWPKVRQGEFKWIYDTQENADYVYNSMLLYELCIMKKYAIPLLKEIDSVSPYYTVANRLIKFLKYFVDLDEKWVPCNSIIREFIGGSCFEDI